jgi:hypothetical protein
MVKVNLDALIPREDFEVTDETNSGGKKSTISIEDMKLNSFFIANVRKPDFQRETNEWEPEKIVEFVESFINGDLIPAIILWRSPTGYLFVIDGSHRLSSLIAWINNDYGDGLISKNFYESVIDEEQKEIAKKTKELIEKRVGLYEDYKLAITNPEKVKIEIQKRSKNLGALAIQLQWVEGDISKAEDSFFKINQQAAPIDKTELVLLKSRKKPSCIAARAIMKSGKGHKYWSSFQEDKQKEIQELASEINKVLFSPRLETPLKTLDIPLCGKISSAQTLPLILGFVNISNGIYDNDEIKNLSDDKDGSETIKFLKVTKKIAQRINSNECFSLGLHPIIYFYSKTARHKPASFLGIVELIKELENKNKFDDFISVRKNFEIILEKYDFVIQQINRKVRYAKKSIKPLLLFYTTIIDNLKLGKSIEESMKEVLKLKDFENVNLDNEYSETQREEFSKSVKNMSFIKTYLESAPRCAICGGFIHKNSISFDHIQRKQDGGKGTVENAQLTHLYCNTTYKN